MKKRFTNLLLAIGLWALGSSAWALGQRADGVYEIGTAQDLADFAALIEAGNDGINGVLTADIDYTAQTALIGEKAKYYGTFDGQGHTVTVSINYGEQGAALFRNMYGVLRNICVAGDITTTAKGAGGVVAFNYGVMENCVSKATIHTKVSGDGTHGGVCGYGNAACVVKGCVWMGTIEGTSTTNCGGLVGWCSGITRIQDCLSIGEMDINMSTGSWALARYSNNNGDKKNNFYCVKNFAGTVDNGAVLVSADQLASGEVAYKLGMSQRIGTDATPLPAIFLNNSARVYATATDCLGTGATGFTNDVVAEPAHSWEGYTCSVCGKVKDDIAPKSADGYYELSTAEQVAWFAEFVNAGNIFACARLTADIDMSGLSDYKMIGNVKDVAYFRGTFDGQFHTISGLTINLPTTDNVGLFGSVAGSARIMNFTMAKDCSILGKTHIGVIGQAYGGGRNYTAGIINLGNVAAFPVNQGGSSGAGVGGIIGNCPGGNVGIIERCASLGTISGTEAAQICGWCGTNQYTLKDCWSTSPIPEGQSAGSSFFRQGSGTKVINCVQAYGDQVGSARAEDILNGGVCWAANGKSADNPVWFQKLGTDEYPNLTSTDIVYQVGTKNCDGTTGDGFGYSNENTGFVQTPHQLVDGICSVCGMPETAADGYYLVSTAKSLKWIADQVNGGNTKLSFRITADLDLSEYTPWEPIGNDKNQFKGNMDGGRHTISNMTVNDETNNCAGLFGTVSVGDFQDLIIDATCSVTGIKYCGGLIGHSTGGNKVNLTRIGTMCDVTCSGEAAAGLIGNANAGSICNITSCWTTGKIKAQKDAACFSGWEGNVGAVIRDSWSVSEVEGYQDEAHYLARYGGLTVTNCYGPAPSTQGGLKNISAEGLADGALCFDLNGDQSSIAWYQNLGEGADICPVPWNDHKQVYANGAMRCDGTPLGSTTYANTKTSEVPDHQWDGGFCSECGTFQADYKKPVNGAYELATAGDIIWFGHLVSLGNNTANARLTADIDMMDVMSDFQPIGAEKGYGGTFDGQGHTIFNFNYEKVGNDAGFIGLALGGMTLQNIIFDKTCSISGVGNGAGIVGGSLSGQTGTVTFRKVGMEGSVTISGTNAGGLIGCNHGSSAKYEFYNCYVSGDVVGINSTGAESAGLTGWAGKPQAIVNSCFVIGEVSGYQTGRDMIRYDNNTPPSITNSYTTSTIGQLPHIDADDAMSGALTWVLNGKSFLGASWYQTLGGENEHPMFSDEWGLVYSKGDDGYADVHDESTYAEFREYIIADETDKASNAIACQATIDEYVKQVEGLADIATLREFLNAYRLVLPAQQSVKASADLYKAYADAHDYAVNYLAENQFSCEERTFLENYLNTDVDPGDVYPNGSYSYVIDNHLLDDEQIVAETEYLNKLLKAAVAADYQPGTEITDLMKNPTLADGFEGWETTYKGSTFVVGGEKSIMPAAESWNSTFDMTQTIEGLKQGIYVLQVNAAFRPFANITNPYYVAMIKLGDNANYIMTEGEDYISKADAEDGINCHLTGTAPDYSYVFEDAEGWVPQGPIGCSYAFGAGRYVNYTAASVGEDGTLTIGIENQGTGLERDWTGFGNFRLFYLGSEAEAGQKLADVIEGYVARAQVILHYEYSTALDANQYPNISQALKEALEEAVDEAAEATEAADQMALVGKFSDLFRQVYECRKAYIAMVEAAARLQAACDGFSIKELISMSEYNAAMQEADEAWTAYDEGSVTPEEALAIAEKLQKPAFMPPFADGAYQLSDAHQVQLFAALVNTGSFAINAVLTADIDMGEVNDYEPIGFNAESPTTDNSSILYKGHFDGQGHRISNLIIDMPDNVGVGFFGSITTGAVIENLILDQTCSITGKDRAGLVGRSTQNGQVTLRNLGNEGNVSADIAPAGILGNANAGSNAYIYSCYSTGVITGRTNAVQIVGWLGTNIACTVTGCWSIATVTGADSDNKSFYRAGGAVDHGNCYSTMGDNSQANLTPAADFESGKVTYTLNGGDTENPIWRQTLGTDLHPMLGTSSLIVYKDGDTYFNKLEADGDVNGDGAITIKDVVAVLEIMAADGSDSKADVNGDGAVTIKDVVAVLEIMAAQ